MAHVWSSRSIDAAQLADLYEWLDRVPLSKTRGQVEKDFADGVLAAEIVKFYFPDIVDMRNFPPAQNIQDRMAQWKLLNNKVFHRIGLNVPSHVMTQLSIGKTGIAQIFLFNLRGSLALSGAQTAMYLDPKLSVSVLSNSLAANQGGSVAPVGPVVVRTTLLDDPMWYKYNLRYNLLKRPAPDFTGVYPNEYEYYWQKKQAERVLKSGKSRKQLAALAPKSFSHPTLTTPRILPPIVGPYGTIPVGTVGTPQMAAAQLELDGKNQQIIEKEDEVQHLRAKLKRMEFLLQSKNAKIQDLLTQLDKTKPIRR